MARWFENYAVWTHRRCIDEILDLGLGRRREKVEIQWSPRDLAGPWCAHLTWWRSDRRRLSRRPGRRTANRRGRLSPSEPAGCWFVLGSGFSWRPRTRSSWALCSQIVRADFYASRETFRFLKSFTLSTHRRVSAWWRVGNQRVRVTPADSTCSAFVEMWFCEWQMCLI
jgi:hypothetical protein